MEVLKPCSNKKGNQARRKRMNEQELIRAGDKLRKIDYEESEEVHPKRTEAEGTCMIPSSIPNRKKPRVTFFLDKAPLQIGIVKKMVSSQNPLLLRFRLMSPWRSPLMHTLLRRNKNSSFLRRNRFKVHKKQQKRLALRPCSTKRLTWTKREQEDARDVQKKEEVEKFREVEVKFKDENMDDLPGIPLAPSNQSKKPGIIFIFEKASLVPAFVGKTYQILNPDDHANFMRKKKMNPYNYRPEIILQVLFQVVNSRLYKAGRVQAIYVKTEEGVLIKIEAHTQIPETFGSFCAMMLELLQKFSIKAKGKREKLLRLVENPVTQHLPVNCYKIGLSFSSKKAVRLKDYIGSINDDVNLVFLVGAMAHGKIDCEYTDDVISVSEFPLSAACCVRKICCAVWKKWKVK